jgi:hypothetical protein
VQSCLKIVHGNAIENNFLNKTKMCVGDVIHPFQLTMSQSNCDQTFFSVDSIGSAGKFFSHGPTLLQAQNFQMSNLEGAFQTNFLSQLDTAFLEMSL